MKNLASIFILAILTTFLAGCSSSDKYDLAAQKLQKERSSRPELKAEHQEMTLPKGTSLNEEKVFHKGEKLPDGTVASEDTKAKTFTIETDGK